MFPQSDARPASFFIVLLILSIGVLFAILVVVSPVSAQSADHLQCYKMKDSNKFKANVDLLSAQFGLDAGCRVKVRGRKFCVPAEKTVNELGDGIVPEVVGGRDLQFDRICYQVKCDSGNIGAQDVVDQFGARQITIGKTTQVCTPAVKGLLAPSCGNAILEPGEECDDSACASGGTCLPNCVCACAGAQCPVTMEITNLAGFGSQVTATELDYGSSGVSHDSDLLDLTRVDLDMVCPGSGPGACGDCLIAGVNPDVGNCRCADDNRASCNEPFAADIDDCGGSVCECYLSPPLPQSAGNTPRCMVLSFAGDPSGTWNPDTGAGTLSMPAQQAIYLGNTIFAPCPTCDGDVTAGDGSRDGTCVDGENDGASCDAAGDDATFPSPGGGSYSLDCFPDAGKLVTAPGSMIVDLGRTTGSVSLGRDVECGFPPTLPADCSCGVCTGDATLACSSNSDCAVAAAGDCSNIDGIHFPTSCANACIDVGGGEGQCDASGPDDLFCDAFLRANGEGFISCLTDTDCEPGSVGVDAGDCTLSKRRECFLDPIAGSGTPDVAQPIAVGVSCTPASISPAINAVSGLPGPVRTRVESETVFRCVASGFTYPGCP